ncbi:OmpA family protein [Cribrihabitans marinus]|uniref:OmpA family protein n=1 Tax=Cribrihabitans marinus TaxID=1227549 RepID=A0A1H7DVC9_9RHOB|nr:OmpA family protein [Cribrihabitans marinus]GGH40111.1 flagellar motor protein MotB [Cribrihabitans marinus]SEK05344.1 OmpA family protein [Cribrihabitans marinus]
MRAQAKRLRHEEEEESAFISMTDMTVGFLFIMMILLAFFASQMQEPDAVSRSDYDRVIAERDMWQERAQSRAEVILRLEAEIEALKQQRERLQAEVNDLNTALEVQRAKVTELTSELEAARTRIADLEARIRELLQQVAERDEQIEDLRRQLAELQKIDPLEAYLAQVSQARREVLQRLRDAIRADFPDLQVELSEESDALRFQGEGLFASGRSDLARDRREIVARLAQRLDEVLPCFTLGEASLFDPDCNPGFVMIEAVQIEGHTDDVGTDRVNRNLSAARANSTFFAMTQAAEQVMQHQNLKRQPVLSVAAYGPDRPVASNETPEGRATNRRIDLRFIMVTPQDTDGIEVIREALESVEDQR